MSAPGNLSNTIDLAAVTNGRGSGNSPATTPPWRHCGVPLCDPVVPFREELCRRKKNTRLDIEELQTFVEVADAGVAMRLGLSKSIVDRQSSPSQT